jgi:hypothetical protein
MVVDLSVIRLFCSKRECKSATGDESKVNKERKLQELARHKQDQSGNLEEVETKE